MLGYKDEKIEKIFIGVQRSQIVRKLTHNNKGQVRDFDRVLVSEGYKKTFAEFSEEEMKDYDLNIWRPGAFDRFINWYRRDRSRR